MFLFLLQKIRCVLTTADVHNCADHYTLNQREIILKQIKTRKGD